MTLKRPATNRQDILRPLPTRSFCFILRHFIGIKIISPAIVHDWSHSNCLPKGIRTSAKASWSACQPTTHDSTRGKRKTHDVDHPSNYSSVRCSVHAAMPPFAPAAARPIAPDPCQDMVQMSEVT